MLRSRDIPYHAGHLDKCDASCVGKNSRLRLILPHQNTIFVRIKHSDESIELFNIASQWSVSNSSEAICPN